MGLNKLQKKKLNEYFTDHPHLSDNQIAKQLKLSHSTITKYRKKFNAYLDREFIDHAVKNAIIETRRSVIHWKSLIEKLNAQLEQDEKTLVLVSNGIQMKSKVPLEPMERMRIIHEIADLEVKIQEWGNDQEISQLLKAIRDGKIQQE